MLSLYHSRLFLGTSATFLSLTALVGQIQKAEAVNITFDYTYDNNNFFADSSRKDLLNQAAGYFENNINDSLPELNPTSPESLTLKFTNPSDTTAPIIELPNQTIAEDQILIFAGSDELGSNTLGFGEKSGSSKSAFQGSTFDNAYATRKAEASLWGGVVSFDLEYDAVNAPNGTRWHFGSDANGLASNEADFLSVAIHEIAHVMGFGTSDNWNGLVSETNFTGAKSQDIFSGLVPLDDIDTHWNDSVTIDSLETAMDPTITNGDRKLLTRLDYAGLEDIGWGVNQSVYNVPFEFSPSLGILVVAGMFGTKKVLNTKKSNTKSSS